MKITVTESEGVLNMAAEIAGVSVGEKLVKISNGVWKLSVQNTAGYELPASGGPGTWVYRIIGMLLVVSAGGWLILRRRKVV